MLQGAIFGRIVKVGVLERSRQNKPNLNFADVYVEGDGGTHRIFKVPDSFLNEFEFGKEVTLLINIYAGEREYLSYVKEVR